MTLDDWLKTHAFLQPIARLRTHVDAAIGAAAIPPPPIPDWNDYRDDFAAGTPLLRCFDVAIDLLPVARAIATLADRLAGDAPDRTFANDMRVVSEELSQQSSPGCVVDWLMGDESWTPSRQGSLHFLGWLAMSASLRPLVDAFDAWRNEDRWLRAYCPACGSPPAMAQLQGTDPGRLRYLSCGRCRSRWRYGRTGCPFCDVKSDRLASFAIDGEGGLRIDYCESCRGYLKTYVGDGDEAVLLADWTSLHVDLAARDRGLQRMAASLYDLDGTSATA